MSATSAAAASTVAEAAVVTDSRLGGQGPSTSDGDDPRPPLERPPPSNPAAALSTDAYGCITTATDNSALAGPSSEHTAPSVVAGVATSTSLQQDGHGFGKASSFHTNTEMSSVHHLLDPARDGNTDYTAYPPSRRPAPSSPHPLSANTSSTTAPASSAYPPIISPSRPMNDTPGSAHSSSSTVASSISLPSMRTFDSMTHQTQHATQDMSSGLGINLPLPPAQSSTAYYQPSGDSSAPPLSTGYSVAPETLSRYALPPDPRSQYRAPKKEIKRRTKTGCLTCRKRRIKCDETHPTCNNCKKSKRECLGYGPIFRPTTVASDGYLSQLPAHKSHLASPGAETASSPSIPSTSPRLGSHDLAGPESYPRPLTAGSSSQHSILNNTDSASPTAFPRGPLSAPNSASSPYTPGSYNKEISTPVSISSPRSRTESGALLPNPDILREGSRPSLPLPKTSLEFLTNSHNALPSRHAARTMRVEDLINSLGPPPPVPEQIQSENTFQEIVKVYHEMYAPGLHAFFESTWFYFSDHGKMSFPRQGNLVGQMAVFLKVLEGIKVNDHAQMSYSSTLELRLVWELAKLASFAASDTADSRNRATLPPESDRFEVMNRFYIVQALLNGEFLPWNPLTPPNQDANHHRMREFDFWYQLGEFLRMSDGEQEPDRVQRREDALGKLRVLLDGRENRDVLYSIVVLRHYAHRFDLAQALQAKYHLPEEDPRNKVVVASKFISSQAHVTGGTTNVIRRICDIAARLYVNSGDNVRLTGMS